MAVTSIRLCFANDAAGRWDAKASELPSHGRETEGLDCPIERRVEGCVAIVEEEPRALSRRYRTIYVNGTPYVAGIHFEPVLEVVAPLFERPGLIRDLGTVDNPRPAGRCGIDAEEIRNGDGAAAWAWMSQLSTGSE